MASEKYMSRVKKCICIFKHPIQRVSYNWSKPSHHTPAFWNRTSNKNCAKLAIRNTSNGLDSLGYIKGVTAVT